MMSRQHTVFFDQTAHCLDIFWFPVMPPFAAMELCNADAANHEPMLPL